MTCCFVGHREIVKTDKLVKQLYLLIENLICDKGVKVFLFGSKSQFDSLCLEIVSKLKEKYPFVKRVYVRAEYEYIDEAYLSYLLKSYDDTYYPKSLSGAGRSVYIKRNFHMIDKSDFCVIYYDEKCAPKNRKSGTLQALEYAMKKSKNVFILN